MEKKQESNHSMQLTVRVCLRQNAAITSPLPNFGTCFSAFSENIDLMQMFKELQEVDKTGIAQIKKQLRSDLIEKAHDVSRKTVVYAKMTENTLLLNEVYYTKTDLKKSTGNMLKDRALLLYDKAMANQSELTAYGLTADILASFKAAIDAFYAALPKPRLGITEKKQATSRLAELFAANDVLLKKLDALVEIVRYTQPAFFADYWNNRKVIVTGTGSLVLSALITDASTKAGIKGVKVRFTPQNGNVKLNAAKSEIVLVKTTKDKGIFRDKSLKPGIYTVVMTKPGFKEQSATVTIAQGEMTQLIAELEKN